MDLIDLQDLCCPECGEEVQDRPPLRWIVPAPVPRWSHLDGTPLCPIVGADGYTPGEPIECASLGEVDA